MGCCCGRDHLDQLDHLDIVDIVYYKLFPNEEKKTKI